MYKLTLILLVLTKLSFGQISYEDSLTQLRYAHADELKNPKSKILNELEIAAFKGLDYFTVDKSYRVEAVFKKKKGKKFKMPTSTDRTPIYRRYGYFYFTINNVACTLTVYQNIELMSKLGYEDYLFVPFRDATSGNETYGGGRYIDLKIPQGDKIIIDFNLCYNPYCAYSYRFSCPIPPGENTLTVRVEAGEKIPFGHE